MKTTFYCVNAEFYDTCEIKACVTETQSAKKPFNQIKRNPGVIAFKLWVHDKNRAETMRDLVKCGEMYIDDCLLFFDEMVQWEKRGAA